MFGKNLGLSNPNPTTLYIGGGCQCGSVRYRITGPLGEATICHCRMCQKAFGSWGAALVCVKAQDFAWTKNPPTTFRSSSVVTRGFCEKCGTPLFMHEDGDSHIEIAIGSLDQPGAITRLQRQSGIESKLPWFDDMHKPPAEKTDDDRSPEDMRKLQSLQHPDHD